MPANETVEDVVEDVEAIATAAYVAALHVELEGYERYGRKERAEQVRAEIARAEGAPKSKRGRPRKTTETPPPVEPVVEPTPEPEPVVETPAP